MATANDDWKSKLTKLPTIEEMVGCIDFGTTDIKALIEGEPVPMPNAEEFARAAFAAGWEAHRRTIGEPWSFAVSPETRAKMIDDAWSDYAETLKDQAGK